MKRILFSFVHRPRLARAVWEQRSQDDAYELTSSFLTSYHDTVVEMKGEKLSQYIKCRDISYEKLVRDIISVLNSFADEVFVVPNLIDSPKQDLVSNLKKRIDNEVDAYLVAYREAWKEFYVRDFPEIIQGVFSNLATMFDAAVVNVDDALSEDLRAYYSKIARKKKSSILDSIPSEMENKLSKRQERAREFYSIAWTGLFASYGRLVTTGKMFQREFLVADQGKGYVRDDIQDRIVNILDRDVDYSLVVSSEADQERFINESFGTTASEIRKGVAGEIQFRVSRGHMPTLIQNRVAELFIF